jgi:hypothetical protein
MSWVPIIPKRSDFCGRPPCGLCYRWAGDEPAPDWIVERFRELISNPFAIPTPAQRVDIEIGAELAHSQLRNLEKPEDWDEAQAERETALAFKADRANVRQRSVKKVKRKPVLDHIDLKKVDTTPKSKQAQVTSPKDYSSTDNMEREAIKAMKSERCYRGPDYQDTEERMRRRVEEMMKRGYIPAYLKR